MIPELAFHHQASKRVTDVTRVQDNLDRLMPTIMEFAVLGRRAGFMSSKAAVDINDLTLIALSHTPYRLDRRGCASPELWIPFSGRLYVSDGRSDFEYGGNRGYLCTSETRNAQTTTVSALGLRFDMQRLNAVHAAIVGAPDVADIPGQTRLVQLDAHGADYLTLIKNVLRQVDELALHSAVLQRLGVDDSLYRIMACLLMPGLLGREEPVAGMRNHVHERVAKLCDFLHGHLNQPVTLTDMEQISGLSARVLQYNFQKSFGMRPKQWLCKQRLHAAHAVLVKSDGRVKLTALAYEYCFPSPSTFSRAYQMEFGELPSETLAEKRVYALL